MTSYVALIRKTRDGNYSARFPDLPRCSIAGRDMDQTLALAREFLSCYLQILRAQSLPLPEASPPFTAPRKRNTIAVLIPVLERSNKTRVNVMLDEYLLKSVDKLAGDRRRSEFLAEAARERLFSV